MCLEFKWLEINNNSKNRIIIQTIKNFFHNVKFVMLITFFNITQLAMRLRFFSVMIITDAKKKLYASTGDTETNVLSFFPFLNSTIPSDNANKE